ncbi:MAG: hypothetical protein JWO48_931 [Bryobacterales bacterium]|nr:hypothetical protein [Bryobacterales bacterium]
MIQFEPRELPPQVSAALASYQAEIDAEIDYSARVDLAAKRFRQQNRKQNPIFQEVRRTLSGMCAGARRCMYCEDSAADEVEHHRPKDLYPEFVFAWDNYLYACGPCNVVKRNRFAVFGDQDDLFDVARKRGAPIAPPVAGSVVLLHPRFEDPLAHMTLDIRGDTLLFVPTASHGSVSYSRAAYTIKLLGLNTRDYLPVARREAYGHYKAALTEYVHRRDDGDSVSALNRIIETVRHMHHPTVWHEMRRQHSFIPELLQLFNQVPDALTSW